VVQQWYLASMSKIQRFLNPRSQEQWLQFHDNVIFYNFVFDIGQFVNPTQAARKLLKEDFACASANHITNTVELAPRLKKLLTLRKFTVQHAVVSAYVQQRKWRAALSCVLHHPRYALSVLRSARRRKGKAHTQTTGTPVEQKDPATLLKETLQLIDDSMAKFQSMEGLQLYADKRLFSPLYLREAPFVRVGLQPFFASIDGEDIGVDVSLVIHRTGVAILTFGVMYQAPKTVDALIDLKVAEHIGIPRFEVAKALVVAPPTAKGLARMGATLTKTQYSGGIEWCRYEFKHQVSLLFMFQLYQNAILAAISGKTPKGLDEPFSWLRTNDWLSYPILFVRQITPLCPTDEAFKKRHTQELTGLVLGFPQWRGVKPEKIPEIIKRDFALTSNYSFYLEASHATVLYYADYLTRLEKQFGKDIPGQEWLFGHFQTSGIVEALLIQEWLLHILDCELSVLPYSLTKLNRLKQHLIFALDEYHKILFSYGTAQDILKGGQEIMGIHDRYEGVVQKLDHIEKLIEVKESQQLTQRNLLLNIVLLLLTFIAGFPGAQQLVAIVYSWNIIHFNPVYAATILYVSILALVLLSVIWQFVPTYKRKLIVPFDQSQIALKKHFTWPKQVRFTSAARKTANPIDKGKNAHSN
jgi:hypothetical protein